MAPQEPRNGPTMPLWTAGEALAATGGAWAGATAAADRPIAGISIDSRSLHVLYALHGGGFAAAGGGAGAQSRRSASAGSRFVARRIGTALATAIIIARPSTVVPSATGSVGPMP